VYVDETNTTLDLFVRRVFFSLCLYDEEEERYRLVILMKYLQN
jgi:hypothetical protein